MAADREPVTAKALPATPSANMQLRIDSHQVHRIDGEELIVSTLKDVAISVVLVDDHERIVDAEMPVSAHLIYENGQPVEQLDRHQPVMKGGSAFMTGGVAAFKLRINALSSLRQNQRLRVLIACMHEEHGKLEVITNAMRSITKLFRGPREQAMSALDGAVGADTQEACATRTAPLKRKSAEITSLCEMIDDHDREIGHLRDSQRAIMDELRSLSEAIRGGSRLSSG